MNDVPALVATAAGMGAGALLLIPFMGWEIAARGLTLDLGWMTCWGAVPERGGFGPDFVLWNYTLHYFSASEASAYINLVPIIAVATGIFSGTAPLVQILGGALAIAGVLLSSGAGKPRSSLSSE
jgi:drug/metabolite transporter (DMT)-like permease